MCFIRRPTLIYRGATECRKEFDSDVGEISFPIEENRPRFEKDIVCPRCGILTMDEVELTELGQTELGAVFFAGRE